LDAAAQEFAEKGFKGGSMRAVARECGIELALVQYHFKDKLTLWEAVLDDVIGRLYESKLDEVMRRVAGRRPAEQLTVYLESLIRHAATNTVFVGIMSHARIGSSPDTDAFRERIARRSHDAVELIRAAQADGEAVPGDPVVIFYMMVGAALRIFMLAADVQDLAGSARGVGALVDEHVRTCIAVFLRRPEAAPAATNRSKGAGPVWPEGSEPDSARPSSLYLFASLDSVIRRSMDEELKALKITQAQMLALTSIADQPRLSSVKLARLLDVAPQSVNQSVKALTDKGLIRGDTDWGSSRDLPMEVTPAGRVVLARLAEVMEGAEAALLDALSFEERGLLRSLLSRLLKRHRPSNGGR
jgi:AcrR family transcriptional regulator/DNA-binding MarR family transcriptional regulator